MMSKVPSSLSFCEFCFWRLICGCLLHTSFTFSTYNILLDFLLWMSVQALCSCSSQLLPDLQTCCAPLTLLHNPCQVPGRPSLTSRQTQMPLPQYSFHLLHLCILLHCWAVSLSLNTFLTDLKIKGLTPIIPEPPAITSGLSLGLFIEQTRKQGFCGSRNRHPYRALQSPWSGCLFSLLTCLILPLPLTSPTRRHTMASAYSVFCSTLL